MDVLARLFRFELDTYGAMSAGPVAESGCRFLYRVCRFDGCAVALRERRDSYRAACALTRGEPDEQLIGREVCINSVFEEGLPTIEQARENFWEQWRQESVHPFRPGERVKHLVAVPTWVGDRCDALILCWDALDSQDREDQLSLAPSLAFLLCSHIATPLALVRELEAMRQMARKIAHLTATPLALAKREITDLLESQKPARQSALARVQRLLDEANKAVERAFLFDSVVETAMPVKFEVRSAILSAAEEAHIRCDLNAVDGSFLRGNPFRVRFALRDLFVCAKTISDTAQCSGHVENGNLRLTIAVPTPLPKDFDPQFLFSPQYHIEVREKNTRAGGEKNGRWPVGISLMLARQLLTEAPPGGTLEAERMTPAKAGFQFEISLPLTSD
jgi:hypothetical protein